MITDNYGYIYSTLPWRFYEMYLSPGTKLQTHFMYSVVNEYQDRESLLNVEKCNSLSRVESGYSWFSLVMFSCVYLEPPLCMYY